MAAFSERLDLSFRSHPLTAGCGAEPVGGSAGGLDQSKASAREKERKQPQPQMMVQMTVMVMRRLGTSSWSVLYNC